MVSMLIVSLAHPSRSLTSWPVQWPACPVSLSCPSRGLTTWPVQHWASTVVDAQNVETAQNEHIVNLSYWNMCVSF